MMISPLRFFLLAQRAEQGEYYIPATGKVVSELGYQERLCIATADGDVLDPSQSDPMPNVLYIRSLNQVRRCFRGRLTLTYLLALAMWVGLGIASWSAVMVYYAEGMVWYRFLLVSVLCFLSCVYTVQAMRPVVHDASGTWINLRNGSTNLQGGTKIRTVKEQRK